MMFCGFDACGEGEKSIFDSQILNKVNLIISPYVELSGNSSGEH